VGLTQPAISFWFFCWSFLIICSANLRCTATCHILYYNLWWVKFVASFLATSFFSNNTIIFAAVTFSSKSHLIIPLISRFPSSNFLNLSDDQCFLFWLNRIIWSSTSCNFLIIFKPYILLCSCLFCWILLKQTSTWSTTWIQVNYL
jgi:hypothetical protein